MKNQKFELTLGQSLKREGRNFNPPSVLRLRIEGGILVSLILLREGLGMS